jgi:hypothetical protein
MITCKDGKSLALLALKRLNKSHKNMLDFSEKISRRIYKRVFSRVPPAFGVQVVPIPIYDGSVAVGSSIQQVTFALVNQITSDSSEMVDIVLNYERKSFKPCDEDTLEAPCTVNVDFKRGVAIVNMRSGKKTRCVEFRFKTVSGAVKGLLGVWKHNKF